MGKWENCRLPTVESPYDDAVGQQGKRCHSEIWFRFALFGDSTVVPTVEAVAAQETFFLMSFLCSAGGRREKMGGKNL